MAEWTGEQTVKDEVSKYFPRCPFCLERYIEGRRDFWTGEDSAACSKCGAKWHLYCNSWTDKMSWAELVKAGEQGGENLLGIRHKPEFWREMALSNLKQRGKPEREKDEKTVVREIQKEVIVKVRCPYCHKLYDETLNICPHCGASR